MGVTGARAQISAAAETLVNRARAHTDLPIAVGLGVSTPEQAADVSKYADGVIVGSAFINAVNNSGDLQDGIAAVVQLARKLKDAIK